MSFRLEQFADSEITYRRERISADLASVQRRSQAAGDGRRQRSLVRSLSRLQPHRSAAVHG